MARTDIRRFEDFETAQDGSTTSADGRGARPAGGRAQADRGARRRFAIGSGLAISACCDLRASTPDATFGMPIARTVGNCLSMANYARLVAALGAPRAKDLIFTARRIDAQEALAAGFVSAVVDDAEAHVTELCERLADHSRDDDVGDQGGAAAGAGRARGRRPRARGLRQRGLPPNVARFLKRRAPPDGGAPLTLYCNLTACRSAPC